MQLNRPTTIKTYG